ncbi:MAG: EamA family transporter RarD [Alphaproteobacteria bacterium]|nr:EamA family transporter RarD [Alphaproteobacteria bacterium]
MSPAFHRLSEPAKGVLFAVIAHLFWGGMAIYFGLIRHINPMEIAVNRGVWSIPVAAVIVAWLGQFDEVWAALKTPKTVVILALTSSIIVFNWTFYIWCIQHGRTLEASLGYFINPLLNVVAGYFFLGERFSKGQIFALLLAAIAVTFQTIATGVFPYLGLALAGSFSLYGLVRKKVSVSPVPGFFVEVLLIAVPLLLLEAWLASKGETHFGNNTFDTLMLLGCGALTAGALIFFAASIKRLRYSTAGLLQYISPTLVFLTAVFIFHEPMDKWKMLSFVIIWFALAVYSISSLREERAKRQAANMAQTEI